MQSSVFKFLLLVGIVLAFCTGESFAQCANHGYIKEDPGSLSKCDQLYTLLEEALVGNSENLYALRRTFYPQTGRPAPLLCVNYNITPYDKLVVNGSTDTQITMKRSTSSLFSVINPYVLLEFISGYVLIFVQQHLDAEVMTISLNVTDTVITPVLATEQEMVETLEIITTRLEAYAEEQGKLTDWDGSGRGYTWEYEYLSQWFWLFVVGDIFLSIFAISLAPQLYLAMKRAIASKTEESNFSLSVSEINEGETVSNQSSDKKKQKRLKADQVFYIFALVLMVILVLEFTCSIYIIVQASTICPTETCLDEVITTRIIILCFIIGVGIVGGLIFGVFSGRLSQKKLCGKFIKFVKEFLTIAGFFAVFVLISINIIPTIILGFVFPFEVITGIVYLPIVGIIVLLFTEVSSYVSSEWGSVKSAGEYVEFGRKIGLCKKAAIVVYWLYHIIVFILFIAATTVIFYFSLIVHNAEVHQTFISTLIPPIILFLLTTLARKYIINRYDPPQTVNIKGCNTALPVKNLNAVENKDTPKEDQAPTVI